MRLLVDEREGSSWRGWQRTECHCTSMNLMLRGAIGLIIRTYRHQQKTVKPCSEVLGATFRSAMFGVGKRS